MGQTLEHGIFLPDEGERNCYSGLAENWVALDTLVGAYSSHYQNTTIHVTASDKQAWNGKADASALTAHTGDTTIHVTAEDKQAWNNHVADTVKHVTAEDKAKWDAVTSKADDSDVVHKSGNETVDGQKTLVNLLPLKGEYLGTEASNNARSLLYFLANRDTQNQSGIFLTKFRQNKAQGSMSGNDIVYLALDILENSVRTNNAFRFNFKDFVNDVPTSVAFYPTGINNSLGGSTSATNKWTKINGVEPSALGMPDLSNGIDISSYLTNAGTTTPSEYTPSVDGYICIQISAGSPPFIRMYNDYGFDNTVYTERNEVGSTSGGTYTRFASLIFPAIKNVKVYIIIMPSTLGVISAKFFPCQGNV